MSSASPASPSEEPPPESANVQASASGDQAIAAVDSTLLNEAQVQLLGVLDGYSALIRRDSSRAQFDNDRLLLFACTVSRGPFLPTHEANRLYRRRAELALTIGEAEHWLRSMAADWQRKREDRTIPGWAIVGADAIEENASSLLGDREAAVVVGSLGLMTYFGIRPTALWPDASVEPDDPANLRTIERWQSLLANPATAAAASAHLGTLAVSPDRPLLGALNARIFDDATRSTLSLICKALSGDFTDLVTSTANSRYLQQWQISRLAMSLSRIDTAKLIMLIAAESTPENQALKRAAATQLATRGEITKDVITIALGGDDDEVAKIVIDTAWQRSEYADLFESAISNLKAEKKNATWRIRGADVTPRILAATCTAEELEASMELDANAWEARQYQKGIDGAPAARAMLSMRESEWVDTLPAPLRAALTENDLVSYVYARHITAAIRYLSQLPSHTDEDLDLIRTRANDAQWSIQAEAADALARSGNATDAKSLLDAVASANAIDRDRILHAALTLGGPVTIEAVAATADNTTAVVVIPFLGQLAQPILKSLLSHNVAKIRIAASDELSGQLNREQIESLLNEYTASASYFYNVAVALDSALYGPRSRCLTNSIMRGRTIHTTKPDDGPRSGIPTFFQAIHVSTELDDLYLNDLYTHLCLLQVLDQLLFGVRRSACVRYGMSSC
jgi:hypothetical protein